VDLRVNLEDLAGVLIDIHDVARRVLSAHAGRRLLVRLVDRALRRLEVHGALLIDREAREPRIAADRRDRRGRRDRIRAERRIDVTARGAVDRVHGALDVDVHHEVAADDRDAVVRLRVAEVAVPVVVDRHAPDREGVVVEAERLQDRRQRRPHERVGRGHIVRLHLTDLRELADDVHRQAIGRVHEHRHVGQLVECGLNIGRRSRWIVLGISS
jgi:hypothetical protein